MPETRFPASAGQYHGELRLTTEGLAFIPVTTRDGDQMCLGLSGWHLDWHEIAGIERVGIRRGLAPTQPSGDVRVHYDESARFVTVAIHGSLQMFFDAADSCAAAATTPTRAVA